ncbi:hypothetical protein [Novosphingobium guangzhouense]|uniref:Uncharacterized protein n=1 Tax=Novosphingobium guangzhouense TaxID=1850347 RepID=A0A2K2G0M9_9SPHN|nr:hypothetical protein [Novosphingobium guangzhouense]PNU04605.1 hypothetical protein A8V01_19545 [Novosphingobium guangzhouense]
MTPFLESLMEGSPHYRVEQRGNMVSFQATGDTEDTVTLFQPTVERLRKNEGDGYSIYNEHPTSSFGYNLIDLVVVELEE